MSPKGIIEMLVPYRTRTAVRVRYSAVQKSTEYTGTVGRGLRDIDEVITYMYLIYHLQR